jgi:hypothetical protein
VRTFFAKVFGVSSLPIKATATASAKGGFNGPYNVMLVLDTTASMNGSDNSCSIKNATRIQCAVAGVQVLLRTLSPCAGGLSSCGAVSGGNVPNPVDEVGMEVFPPLKDATQSQYDYDCSSKQPTIASSYGQTSPQPVYQIISYSSDYRTSDTAAALNPTSNLAKAVGQGSSPCQPMDAVGGIGTFYADAIDNAQANFPSTTERPNTTNVIIFLGDGDANATKSNMPAGEYPNQCHEAISAAQAAANAGTWVYTIAYGASTSAAGSCSTDSPPTGTAAISACATLQNMASSPGHIPDASKFFSDTVGGTSSCTSAAHSITDLDTIFKTIAGDLTVARLIPNGTT